MSEAVEILIKADDQASKEFGDAAAGMEAAQKRVNQIIADIETPAEEYAKKLAELNALHESGALTADQFAAAHEHIKAALESSEESIKTIGSDAKKASAAVGSLANTLGATGVSGAADFASKLAGATETVSQFREAAKSGGAGAMAFKVGLVGLAAAGGAAVGKFLGDIIFETKKFTREMERAKEASKDLEKQLSKSRDTLVSNKKEDIELIADPEKKKAAYQSLLSQLDKDLQTVTGNVAVSQKAVDSWAEAWQITGERKAAAVMAGEQLANDKARLEALRDQRSEIQKLVSARAEENAAIAATNEANKKSGEFLAGLREEIELLKATKGEQIALEAARNTTTEDRGEAEQLLKERDAILAKQQAMKDAETERQKAIDEAAKAAEKAIQDKEHEAKRLEDIVKSEQERLALRKIELEQGKEAARVQALMNQGVDERTARQLAADEAALEKPVAGKEAAPLQASESRLLTRGEGNSPLDKTNEIMTSVRDAITSVRQVNAEQLAEQRRIAENTGKTQQLKTIA